MPNIIVEEDRVLRLVNVVLDPATSPELVAAFGDYVAHDVPAFADWCAQLRRELPVLHPSRVQPADSQQALQAALADADVAFVESLAIGETELALAPRLKVVQQFGTQVDNIDLAACARRGITVRTLRRRTNTAVAEHTMALILSLARRFQYLSGMVTASQLQAAGRPFRSYDRRHVPGANYGRIEDIVQLDGATLGILGLGEIGAEVARRARAFGMQVLYHKRHRLSTADEAAAGVSYRGMEDLFRESDFLSIHLPSDAATAGLVDGRCLEVMKPGAFLVNTSRAAVVRREALLACLDSGRLGGLAMDVHYEEPVAEQDPLLGRPEVLLIPHTAGGSRRNGLADMQEMLCGIEAALQVSR